MCKKILPVHTVSKDKKTSIKRKSKVASQITDPIISLICYI